MSEPQPEHDSTTDSAEQPDPVVTGGREAEPDNPAADVEPIQPSEAADEQASGTVIELHTAKGSLTLRPTQTVLDENQKAALVAIGIDVVKDPQVVPHVRAFMHMCQVKDLDPWAREAYLIGRGKGDNRKYTMQTGIDGYRKMAGATGRFIRVADTLWTGADDDDRSYYRDENGVMRRVWYDQWPASRGYPGAAKVVIEHYDEANNIVRTEAVADWSMYAPFSDKYEGYGQSRRKVIDPETRKPVQELNEMWRKGYAHMLAKCAEALAHRKAFPARMSGIYTHEEMHRADQQERARIEAEQANARRTAFESRQQQSPAPALATPEPPEPPEDASQPSGPIPVGETAAEVVQDVQERQQAAPQAAPDDATKAEWLHRELEWQAEVIGVTVQRLATRQVAALRKNVEDFTLPELHAMVAGMREATLNRMRTTHDAADVERYASVGAEDVVDVTTLFVVSGEVMPDDEQDGGDGDPDQPHTFVDDGDGVCSVCGEAPQFGNDPLHPPA